LEGSTARWYLLPTDRGNIGRGKRPLIKMRKLFDHTFQVFSLILCTLVAVLALILVFLRFGIGVVDSLKFLAALGVMVYIPGQALCWAGRLQAGRLNGVTLAVVLGITTTTLMYKLSRWLEADSLFWGWLILALAFFVWRLSRRPPKKEDFSWRISWTGIGLAGILLLVVWSLWVDNYANGILQPDGSVVINLHYYDGFIRTAVVREVSHTVPPQMPFAAGLPISYHYGMDCFIASFHRYWGLDVLDLIHRFTLTLFMGLLAVSAFVFTRELTESAGAGLLAAFLAVFGSGGFAFAATYLLGIYQWGNIFYSFTFFNFAGINSLLPALSVLIMGFFCLGRYFKSGQGSWLACSALLMALSAEFKMFLLAPVVGALFLAGLLAILFQKDAGLWKAFGLTVAFSAPMIGAAFLSNSGGPQYVFKIRFVDWIRWSLRELKLTALQRAWADVVHRSQVSLTRLLALLPAAATFFFGSLGASIAAVPGMLQESMAPRRISPLRLFLIVLFGGSVLYIFVIDMSFDGRSRNLVYVYKLGLVVLGFFWAEAVVRFCRKIRPALRPLVILLVLGVSVPNTVRFLWIKHQTPFPKVYPAEFIEAAEWASRHTEANAVFLHPVSLESLCYFMDRRVVMDATAFSFLPWHLTEAQLTTRAQDVRRFFDDPGLHGDVLDTYAVTYVLVPRPLEAAFSPSGHRGRSDCYVDLGTKRIRKFRKSHELERIFDNDGYIILRVHVLPDDQRLIYIMQEGNGRRVFIPFADEGEEVAPDSRVSGLPGNQQESRDME